MSINSTTSLNDLRGCAAVHIADAMLRALAGATVYLRLPVPLANGGTASELGLNAPVVEDVAFAPVVVRTLTNSRANQVRFELLLSASAVQQVVELRNLDSAAALFSSALGIVYNGDLFLLESFTSDEFAGMPYLFRVVATSSDSALQTQPGQ